MPHKLFSFIFYTPDQNLDFKKQSCGTKFWKAKETKDIKSNWHNEHLNDQDTIASTHRGHGHCIAKGCDITEMMKELFGKKDGICGGKGGSMHIADLSKGMLGANGIVGGGPPLVCGAALTYKTKKTNNVSVGFFGDGASNQGSISESMNMASVLNLPAIFVCEDNGFAESTSSSYAVGGTLVERAKGFGLDSYKVDGTKFF